ncbi:MAG: glycoside hydrolase [Herbinix sp.]|nr:glycoside hydrolase [Herbinix sp.]
MKKQFHKDLIHSGLLHRPLPLYEEGSLEKQWEQRTVMNRRAIWSVDTSLQPIHSGEGRISVTPDAQEGPILSLEGNTITYCWPEAMSPDGDCAFYGTVHARLPIDNENWETYHCLTFYVKPDCDGARIVNINLGIKNDGEIKVPDEYYREGSHVVNLKNHEWNRCIWEFGSMARDMITELEFNCRLNGKDTSSGEKVSFQIKEVYLEQVSEPEPDKGWFCKKEGIAYSSSGYFLQGQKQAITACEAEVFQIMDATENKVIYQGIVQKQSYLGEEYSVLDFSCVMKEGSYRIKVDEQLSKAFPISNEIYEDAIWKVLNFLFCERCGYPVPNKHGLCHQDVIAQHEGRSISFGGGWHDAGDMSQQLIHTAEVTQALFETAESIKLLIKQAERKNKRNIDQEPLSDEDMEFKGLLYDRLIEEALWGLEFVLKSRFGDGYRATSAGLVRWTNGLIGDEDDVEVRCHNHAFENLLCSGICAVAAKYLKDTDEELAWKCLQIAEEDFDFGMKRWDTVGMELPIMWEHTYSSSKAQYYALISWTASSLYERTGHGRYGVIAATYGTKLLQCQEREDRAGGIKGFFYRDEEHKIIVHYSHQSREYMFVQAFERLCDTQPEHAQKAEWEQAMRLYGEYIKKLMEYASPYHMLPAGLYHENEIEDRESFRLLHLLVDYESQKEHYLQQMKSGFCLEDGYYIRNFPVWFSFRGNTAIHLAMGHASSIVGRYFHDEELQQLAKEQLYWISGKNPFQQSLMYGEGDRYMQQYAVMPGEMTGELPVGIQTNEDEDLPYWPHNNNATYKEVWTSSACRWLWSISSIYQGTRE